MKVDHQFKLKFEGRLPSFVKSFGKLESSNETAAACMQSLFVTLKEPDNRKTAHD